MEERRRVPRIVELLPVKEINGQTRDDCFVLDHSSLGVRLETPLIFSPGDSVEFIYVREEQEFHRWGQVIWTLPAPDKPGRFLMGVEFFLDID
jgi:hypothetical protein